MDIEKLGKQLQKRLKTFGALYLKNRSDWLRPYPIGVSIGATIFLRRHDWPALTRSAAGYRRDARRDLSSMADVQHQLNEIWNDVQSLHKYAATYWKAPSRVSDWASIRARILKKLRSKGLKSAEAERAVADFAKLTAQDALNEIFRLLDSWSGALDFAAQSRFCALAAADISEAVSQLNIDYESGKFRRPPSHQEVRRAMVEIDNTLEAMYKALRGNSRKALMSKARNAEVRSEQLLKSLLRTASYYALQTAAETDAEAGRKAVEVADACRMALLARSAARLTKWKAGWFDESSLLLPWRKAAKSKTFPSAVREPRETSLAKVIRAPRAFNGKYIRVFGQVGPVGIVHRRRKVISSTSISDASGNVLRVGLTHIKLDSGGLVPGTYAYLTGTFTTKHKDFDTPVLELDRRKLSEGARSSWLDWLNLELSPIITPVPHGLSGQWSLLPGSNGPGNLLRYGTWAKPSNSRGRSF